MPTGAILDLWKRPPHRRHKKCRFNCHPLMSLLRLLTPVISIPDCTPNCLCLVSFVTAALDPLPFRHQQGFPVANHCIYHYIGNGGRKWVAMGNPYLSVEGCTVVISRPCHHPKPHPILLEETKGPGPHAITLQDTQATGPVQGIVRLVQVQEYCMEDRIPQGCNLLNNDMGSNQAIYQVQDDRQTLGKYPIRVRVRVRYQLPTAQT